MKKIFITGPESCGKTALSEYLHTSLPNAFVHSEYAREYLEQRSGFDKYSRADLKEIVATQIRLWHHTPSGVEWIIYDTDPLVLKIWIEEVYQEVWDEVEEAFQDLIPDLTLLCAPDIPWEKDPLRENPSDRSRLYLKYKSYLIQHQLPFVEIKGVDEQRNSLAIESIIAALSVDQSK